MKFVEVPPERFANLKDYAFAPHFLQDDQGAELAKIGCESAATDGTRENR